MALLACLLVYDIKSEPMENPERPRIRLSKLLDIEELDPALYSLSESWNQGRVLIEFGADRKGLLQGMRGVYLFRDQALEALWIPLVVAENGVPTNATIRLTFTVPSEWRENLSLFIGCNDIRERGTLYGATGENAPFPLVEIPSSACIDGIHAARMIYDASYSISLKKAMGNTRSVPALQPIEAGTNEAIRVRIKL